jgi:hypothetical protein
MKIGMPCAQRDLQGIQRRNATKVGQKSNAVEGVPFTGERHLTFYEKKC